MPSRCFLYSKQDALGLESNRMFLLREILSFQNCCFPKATSLSIFLFVTQGDGLPVRAGLDSFLTRTARLFLKWIARRIGWLENQSN